MSEIEQGASCPFFSLRVPCTFDDDRPCSLVFPLPGAAPTSTPRDTHLLFSEFAQLLFDLGHISAAIRLGRVAVHQLGKGLVL